MNIDMAALHAIEADKGISVDVVVETIKSALLTAYRHTEGHEPDARIDTEPGARADAKPNTEPDAVAYAHTVNESNARADTECIDVAHADDVAHASSSTFSAPDRVRRGQCAGPRAARACLLAVAQQGQHGGEMDIVVTQV